MSFRNQEDYTPEREGWDPGEWDSEPDLEEWVSATGFRCEIMRQLTGHLCGYVAVGEKHPLYRRDFSCVADILQAHGEISYAEPHACDASLWVFGFDCGHSGLGDIVPGCLDDFQQLLETLDAATQETPDNVVEGYRNWALVKAQTEQLAKQLLEHEKAFTPDVRYRVLASVYEVKCYPGTSEERRVWPEGKDLGIINTCGSLESALVFIGALVKED